MNHHPQIAARTDPGPIILNRTQHAVLVGDKIDAFDHARSAAATDAESCGALAFAAAGAKGLAF